MKIQFTAKENIWLTEIYRRLNYFHKGDTNTELLLLAYPGDVKTVKDKGILKPSFNERPRSLNWYSLTQKGKELFKNHIRKDKITEAENLSIFIGKKKIDFSIN